MALVGFPAHAGMDPRGPRGSPRWTGLPRARGDGPQQFAVSRGHYQASPRTRGWTVVHTWRLLSRKGFPAHAGMDRSQ